MSIESSEKHLLIVGTDGLLGLPLIQSLLVILIVIIYIIITSSSSTASSLIILTR